MKKRTTFIAAILSLFSLGHPLLIKTGFALSNLGLTFFIIEKVNADQVNVSKFFKTSNKRIEEGDYEGAISIMEKLIMRFPKFANSYYQRGYINAVYLQKYEDAIPDFSRAIHLHKRPKSNLPLYFWMRGFAKKEINDLQGACSDWRQVKRLGDKEVIKDLNQYCNSPEKANAYTFEYFYELGEKKIKLKDYRGAVAAYTSAIELEPKNDEIYYSRGWTYTFYLKKHKKAISDFTKAIKLSQGNQNLKTYLGQRAFAKFQINDNKGACLDWEKAYKLGDEYSKSDLDDFC